MSKLVMAAATAFCCDTTPHGPYLYVFLIYMQYGCNHTYRRPATPSSSSRRWRASRAAGARCCRGRCPS